MDKKEKQVCLKLYEVAEEIRRIEPWNYLWDRDILMLVTPKIDQVVYCSVMGKTGLYRGIAIYLDAQIFKMLAMSKVEYPIEIASNYQECLLCQYDTREYTLPENRKLIKELGLKYRGEWISFENHEIGYAPSKLTLPQAEIMLETLKNFYMTFRSIREKGVGANFEKGETLLRIYDEKTKLWNTMLAPLLLPHENIYCINMSDPNFLKEIKKVPRTDTEMELEMLNYLPLPIYHRKEKRKKYPRIYLLMNHQTGEILEEELIEMNEDITEKEYIDDCIQRFINAILSVGIPKTISVRDKYHQTILQDICDKANINLKITSKLNQIDNFYEKIMSELTK